MKKKINSIFVVLFFNALFSFSLMGQNQVFKEAFRFDRKTTTSIMRANDLESSPDFFSNIEDLITPESYATDSSPK